MIQESEIQSRLQPVVIGGDILAYSYVRELHRAFGIQRTIVVAASDIKMLSTSSFTDYRIHPNLYRSETFFETLEQLAAQEQTAHPDCILLLLGCNDTHARLLSFGKKRLEKAGFVVPTIDFALLDGITQKRRFYEICDELAIPYPKTWYCDCSDAGPETIDTTSFPYPLIAKPSNSAQFEAADIPGKRKIYEIEDAEELASVWKDIRHSDYDNLLILQDFIPGNDDAIRTLTTVSDAQGEMRVASGGVVCLQDHDPTALGNPLCILGEQEDAIIECARRFLKHVGYRGVANFDIKYDSRDGSFRFFEVNTRCGRNTYYMSLGGVNFAELIVREFVLEQPLDEQLAYHPFAYCCVPKYVLKKSMDNPERLKQVLATLRQTKEPYPLHYGPDSFAHNFWAYTMFVNQIRKFKRFYWDTGGKQLK